MNVAIREIPVALEGETQVTMPPYALYGWMDVGVKEVVAGQQLTVLAGLFVDNPHPAHTVTFRTTVGAQTADVDHDEYIGTAYVNGQFRHVWITGGY